MAPRISLCSETFEIFKVQYAYGFQPVTLVGALSARTVLGGSIGYSLDVISA